MPRSPCTVKKRGESGQKVSNDASLMLSITHVVYAILFRPFLDGFGTVSDGFGPFSDGFGRYRTVSDNFRTVSDAFRSFSDRFGSVLDNFRIVFRPFQIVLDDFGACLDCFRKHPFEILKCQILIGARPSRSVRASRPAPALAN